MGKNGRYKQQERQSPVPLMTGEQCWGEPIPEKRKVELNSYLQNWEAEKGGECSKCRGPFDQVRLTGADVFHLVTRALPGTKEKGGLVSAPVHAAQQNVSGGLTPDLSTLQLQGADLTGAHLERAFLTGAQLQGAVLHGAQLQGAVLDEAQLQGALLDEAQLEQAVLRGAQLQGAILRGAQLQGALLDETRLEQADLTGARLEHASLAGAHLQKAVLTGAQLEQAVLRGAQLQGAILAAAQLQGALLDEAQLQGAILTQASFDKASRLHNAVLTDATFDQVIFDNTNLTVVDWSMVDILGDEHLAHQSKTRDGLAKDRSRRVAEYKAAVRANRQLSVVLQDQGLNEDAARFAYRAQILQKTTVRYQLLQTGNSLKQRIQSLGAWLFSWFLFLLAGYGYKPGRSFLAYVLVIGGFATTYYLLGVADVGPHHAFGPHHLAWYEAIVVSMTAFHGRGFLADQFKPGDPQAFVAAFEALVGLLIEVTFIATLTRRFFGQ